MPHSCPPCLLPVLLALGAAVSAQAPDAATLDGWWRSALAANDPTRTSEHASLRQHAAAAVERGMLLLRKKELDLPRDSLAFAIAGIGGSGFEALLQEIREPKSPARVVAFEAAWRFAHSHAEGRVRARDQSAMREILMSCLDTDDEALMRAVERAVTGIHLELQAMLELRLAAAGLVGPRAAVFRQGGYPRPPEAALRAALEDPMRMIREAAAIALAGYGPADGVAATTDVPALDPTRTRELYGVRPWPPAAREGLLAIVSAELPASLDHAGSMDLWHRRKLVGAAALRLDRDDPDAAVSQAILTAALRLPNPEERLLRHCVDELRATATRAMLTLGDRMPADAAAALVEQAGCDSLEWPLQGLAYLARFHVAPPTEADRAQWSARCRRAIDAASVPMGSAEMSALAATAIADTYEALGRLGDLANQDWLRERIANGEVARGAAAGALLRLSAGDPPALEAVRSYLHADPGPWPHDRVLARALADRGAESAWALPLLLDRLPRLAADDLGEVGHHLITMALAAPLATRASLRDDLLRRLREQPIQPQSTVVADVIAAIDPAAAFGAQREPGFGPILHSAFWRASSDCVVPLLDSDQPNVPAFVRHGLLDASLHGQRSPAAIRAALVALLRRPQLHDADFVLSVAAEFAPTPDMLPVLESWLPRTNAALRPMVAIGEAAVARIAAVGLARLEAHDVFLLAPLGEHGGPLIPLLLAHENEAVRKAAPLLLPSFGRPGIDALREIERDGKAFCRALVRILGDSSASETVRLAAADELLLHPDVGGIGYSNLRTGASAALLTRMLLLQVKGDPYGKDTTDGLLDILASSNPTLRAFALRHLAGNPDRERVAAYVHWLRQDLDPAVQRALQAFETDKGR